MRPLPFAIFAMPPRSETCTRRPLGTFDYVEASARLQRCHPHLLRHAAATGTVAAATSSHNNIYRKCWSGGAARAVAALAHIAAPTEEENCRNYCGSSCVPWKDARGDDAAASRSPTLFDLWTCCLLLTRPPRPNRLKLIRLAPTMTRSSLSNSREHLGYRDRHCSLLSLLADPVVFSPKDNSSCFFLS
jgi:hypothetical protein